MNPAAAWSTGKIGEIVCNEGTGDKECFAAWLDMLPPLHEALDQLNTEYMLGAVHVRERAKRGVARER
jgi:hypothetical protein